MRVVYGPSKSYKSNVAEKERRRFLYGLGWLAVGLGLIVAAGVYAIFFSPLLELNSVKVSGAKETGDDLINIEVKNLINKKGILNSQNNTLFFDEVSAGNKLMALFPILQSVSIEKKFPHEIAVKVIEREAIGIWCFDSSFESAVLATSCSFFDDNGYIWGKAIKSSGSLLMTVEDPGQMKERIAAELLQAVINLNRRLFEVGVYINSISVHNPLPGDITVRTTDGWNALFTDSYPIEEQLLSLKTLLGQEGFNSPAQYIDLRIQGRVYYK